MLPQIEGLFEEAWIDIFSLISTNFEENIAGKKGLKTLNGSLICYQKRMISKKKRV